MALQAVSNFKCNGKVFMAGDVFPEKAADGKPFVSDKDKAALIKDGHLMDSSKITAMALDDLAEKIKAKKAELAALESALDKKKPAAPAKE